MAVKRWTKAAPERAQVVASGRGSGMSHPSGGAYGRAGLCPGDCGSRGARREKLRHLLTATDACRLAILEKRGRSGQGRGEERCVYAHDGLGGVAAGLLDSPRWQFHQLL